MLKLHSVAFKLCSFFTLCWTQFTQGSISVLYADFFLPQERDKATFQSCCRLILPQERDKASALVLRDRITTCLSFSLITGTGHLSPHKELSKVPVERQWWRIGVGEDCILVYHMCCRVLKCWHFNSWFQQWGSIFFLPFITFLDYLFIDCLTCLTQEHIL